MNNINNKKGISTIVATVLIVLITVAAVTILWAAISPLIDGNLQESTNCLNVADAVKIDTDTTHTHYSTAGIAGHIDVRVKRSANSDSLEGFELIIEDEGSTVTTGIPNPRIWDDINVVASQLLENGAKVYRVDNVEGPGSPLDDGNAPTVSIAPRVLINGEAVSCEAQPPITLKTE